ncbi:leucine-rich repeat-containing protein 74B-like [Mya arenaria]|uniref:leucine-rich repeat-containing protein 74B-like n=1 Tax=Mya arenaria TaxID=6604 RepID=UPI0022E4DDA3|nr:leucine-rich repeat-containing protein 74B-like [Mya arenaria]
MLPARKAKLTARMRLASDENADKYFPDKMTRIENWLHNVESHSNASEVSATGVKDRRPSEIAKLETLRAALEKFDTNLDLNNGFSGSAARQRSRGHDTPAPSRTRTYIRLDLPLPVRVYRKHCKRLKVLPLRRVLGQFGRPRIILNDLCMSLSDVRAACKGLAYETSAAYLDVSGNSLGAVGVSHLLQMLAENKQYIEVRIADNCLTGNGILLVSHHFLAHHVITVLDISGNRLTDTDGTAVANIIKASPQLRVLHVHHNEFCDTAGKVIGKVIANHKGLKELDISWNHLRQRGAIAFCKGVEKNTSIEYLNIGWNGFGFEGCVAMADALRRNCTLEKLDFTCNRIHPPALLELMKGLLSNKILRVLVLDKNPITPSFATVLLEGIMKTPSIALEELSLQGIVVDKDFQGVLDTIHQGRGFSVEYETSLPVTSRNRNDMLKEIEMRSTYNIEPLRMLYLLKERNRAQDFFHKINKDHNDGLTPDELAALFKESGIPVARFVVDKIMNFMDTDGDGKIDLGEFLVGDKKIKRLSRDLARKSISEEAHYSRYSRTFRQAHIQNLTSRLKVEEAQNYLSPITSLTPSPASSRRSSVNYP